VEVLSRHDFKTVDQAQAVVLGYGFYNHDRRHSTIGMVSPINYENTAAPDREPHSEALHDSGATTLCWTQLGRRTECCGCWVRFGMGVRARTVARAGGSLSPV